MSLNVFDHLPASGACIDQTGEILAVNQQWREFAAKGSASHGLAQGNGHNYLNVCDNAVGDYAEFAQMAATGIRQVVSGAIHKFEMEYPCHAPTSQQWAILQVVPLSEETAHFLILNTSVTFTKLLQERNKQQERLSSLTMMAAGIAHDINNLLQVVTAQLSICQYRLDPEAPIRPNLEKAVHGIERTAALTKQILTYSGGAVIKREPVWINALLDENQLLLQAFADRSQVDLVVQLGPSLPAIQGDSESLLQLILNLVSNAVDATAGDVNGQVTITTEQTTVTSDDELIDIYTLQPILKGLYVLLSIADNNGGIPPEILQIIFDPFFSTKQGTRGLGLSIVTGVLRKHGGAVQIQSRAGEGTKFCIYLPVIAPTTDTQPETAQGVQTDASAEQTMVLIINDDKTVLMAISDLLTTINIPTIALSTGQRLESTLASLPSGQPTVAILDMRIKNESVEEIFSNLRSLRPHLPIIIASGYSQNEMTESILHSYDNVAFLHKPYGMEALLEAIHEASR